MPDPLLQLYGLTAAGISELGHDGCAVNEFCRNPLHPGPCKGWKKGGTVAKAVKAAEPKKAPAKKATPKAKSGDKPKLAALADAWGKPSGGDKPAPAPAKKAPAKKAAPKVAPKAAPAAPEPPQDGPKPPGGGAAAGSDFDQHKQGSDLFAANPSGLALDVTKERGQFDGKAADTGLAAIGAKQGYDGLPKVVSRSEMDALVAAGHPAIHRGVRTKHIYEGGQHKETKTGAQIHEDMRSGPAFYGNGIFGNGYYWGAQESTADNYSYGEPGGKARAVLSPNAKVAKYDDLIKEHTDFLEGLQGHPHEAEMRDVYSDPGRYAAARGFDAIAVYGFESAAEKNPMYNVLNRTALIVQEADK